MLSEFGKRLYFPKGILAQAAEAKEKATQFDATVGIARENGKPMFLPSVMKYFEGLSPADALTYAPAAGRADLRKQWKEQLIAKNPSLAEKAFSVDAPRIKECFLNIECEYLWEHENFEGSRDVTVALRAKHICMDADFCDEDKKGRYGQGGYMYNIHSPRNPLTGEVTPDCIGAIIK
jgi:hypothetical protein